MKTVHLWLKSILCSAMLVLLASCATYMPPDSTVGNMDVKEARKVIAEAISWSTNLRVVPPITTKRLILEITNLHKRYTFTFSELGKILVTSRTFDPDIVWLSDEFNFSVPHAEPVVNALYVLEQNAIKQKKEADEFDAGFATSLANYSNKISSKATLSEAANKYKVQAEGAVRDKQFDDAADLYAEALKIAPWWPAGHFNRALVLSETGDYEMAIREMKHYLQLVPEAPNARAAQDKIYDWERMESK